MDSEYVIIHVGDTARYLFAVQDTHPRVARYEEERTDSDGTHYWAQTMTVHLGSGVNPSHERELYLLLQQLADGVAREDAKRKVLSFADTLVRSLEMNAGHSLKRCSEIVQEDHASLKAALQELVEGGE